MTKVCCTASAEASKTKIQVIAPATTVRAGPAANLNSSSIMSWPVDRKLQEPWAFETAVPYERRLHSGS
jgi:hypothetical protein